MFGSIIIPAAIVLLVAFIIAVIAGIKVESKKGEEDMIKHIYIYLVLFATLMMTIGGSIGAFMAIADMVAPTPYYQSFEDYARWGRDRHYLEMDVEAGEELSQEELEKLRERYDAMVKTEINRQVERAKNNLIKSFGWIIIPFPVFIYFQRRLNRNNKSRSDVNSSGSGD